MALYIGVVLMLNFRDQSLVQMFSRRRGYITIPVTKLRDHGRHKIGELRSAL